MAPPVDNELFSFACHIADQAAQLTLQWFQRTDLRTDIKSDGTEVTDADRAAEDFLLSEIADAFPNDTVIGEEAENYVGNTNRRWIIDPIDGTANYFRGLDQCCISIALMDKNEALVGVVYNFNNGEIFCDID